MERNFTRNERLTLVVHSSTRRRQPKYIRYPRRTKSPPDFGVNLFLKKTDMSSKDPSLTDLIDNKKPYFAEEEEDKEEQEQDDTEEGREQDSGVFWDSDEIEAISSLFQGRVPQKPGKLSRERPLPLPLPYKLRPLGLPTPKKHVKSASPTAVSYRASLSKQVYKNPRVLIAIAKEIRSLSSEEDVSVILNKWARFLRSSTDILLGSETASTFS
jgi:hypothetical protein